MNISDYYAVAEKVLPPDGEAAQPVTRLTPRLHNITIENVTATGSRWAGVIVGLPEAPITGVVLRNVRISAQHGLTIRYADVTGAGVVVEASRWAANYEASRSKSLAALTKAPAKPAV